MATDRRSMYTEEEKEMQQEEEPIAAAEEAVEQPQEQEKVKPLGIEYARKVAELWPTSAQGKSVLEKLPLGLKDMLDEQTPEFILGFANGVQCIHDIALKMILDEIYFRVSRIQQQMAGNIDASMLSPTDKLALAAIATTEGIGYLACKALVEKEPPEEVEKCEK